MDAARMVMHQVWHDLLFAHWPMPADVVRRHVPPGLRLDTWGGTAWVGVVPFRMSAIRPRGMPALPRLSALNEINVRTYVTVGDRAGVYFFSLDATSVLAVGTARAFYDLPYYPALMTCEQRTPGIRYKSRRLLPLRPEAQFLAYYEPTGDVFRSAPGSLEHFLTERYCLYTLDMLGRPVAVQIAHEPWPLQPASADIVTNTMAAAVGLMLPDTPPVLHFARRLDVRIGWPRRVDADRGRVAAGGDSAR